MGDQEKGEALVQEEQEKEVQAKPSDKEKEV